MKEGEYKLVERKPTVEEYRLFRAAVGWWPVDDHAVEKGLDRTLFSVSALHEGKMIGLARIVGDGGVYFYIQDMIVLPKHQRKGVGKLLMGALMTYLVKNARKGSFIGLMAAKGAAPFYEKYGFEPRPEGRPGMFLVWE